MGPGLGVKEEHWEPAAGTPEETQWLRGAPARGPAASPGLDPSSHLAPRPPFPSITPPPALSLRLLYAYTCLSVSFSTAFSTTPYAPMPLPRVLPYTPTIVLSHHSFHKCRVAFSSCRGDAHPIARGRAQVPPLRWPDRVSRPSPEQEGELPAPLPAQPPAQPGPPPCSQHAENGEYPQPGLAKGAPGGATLKRTEEAMPVPGALSPGRVGQRPASFPLWDHAWLPGSGGGVRGGRGGHCFPLPQKGNPWAFPCIPSRCPGDQKTWKELGSPPPRNRSITKESQQDWRLVREGEASCWGWEG